MMLLIGVSLAPMNDHNKEKCGADFVYLSEGCGKTQAIINLFNTPHSDRYEVSGSEGPDIMVYTNERVLSVSYCFENYHIF